MTDIASPPKTALEIVLEWSLDRPAWQRDALRRIVQSQKLNETDITELVALCKRGRREQPLPSDPEPKPLEASHLPANPGAGVGVTLTAVKDVSAVNNLAPGQTLSFAPAGITVVYGDNGAGKSGYVRILKRACRARHSEVILPNVYGEPATKTASATLCYNVGGKEQAPETWIDTGKPEPQPHPILSAISVFDADCASVHVKGKNEVAFQPFGFDIPNELGNACKQVRAVLEAEKKQLEATRNGIFPILPIDRNTTTPIAEEAIRNLVFGAVPWSAATEVGKALARLTHATDPAVLEKLATLSEQGQARLNRLTEDLSKNPATAAAEQKLKADRIKRLVDSLAVLAALTTDDALNNLLALRGAAAAKRAAARLAAEHLFGTELLPDVGGEVWRALWEAARRYSTEAAYPTALFPPTAPDTLCVLCQQPLSAEAIQRMERFESFIRDDTERQAQEEEAKYETATSTLKKLAISLRPVVDGMKEVELHDKALGRAIRRALASARLRRYMALRSEAGHAETAILAAELFPGTELAVLESEIRKYSDDLQKAAAGEERKALEGERQELADRAALNTQMPAVKAEIGRLQAIQFLETCIADTATNAITALGNEIADQVLTPRLRDKFAAEIIELVGGNIRVEMVRAGGRYGSPQYQIQLLAKPGARVAEVLSEGEQTCVAIAAFLAELATAPHNSALVFDDPISSLDHRWRHKVADRLVAEAAVRQVIVFTHDMIFLNDIEDAAKRTPCESRHICRSATTIGMVNAELPWDGMKVAARVDNLEKRARAMVQVRTTADEETYKREARYFYDDLRAAWERALEEVAFAHVVMRHRDYIRSRDLLRVSTLTEQDCNLWTDNFQRCCDLIAAHDGSRGRNRAMPEPGEVLRDVQSLDTWVRNLRDRQKTKVQTSIPLPLAGCR